MTRWYEGEAASEWLLNSVSAESYEEIYRILHDECLLEEAACCMALSEERLSPVEFSNKVNEIMKSADHRLDAAIFLLYKGALTLEKALKLSSSLKTRQGFRLNSEKPHLKLFPVDNPQGIDVDEMTKMKI